MTEREEPICWARVGQSDYPRVATLGDPLGSTCSVELAKAWLGDEGGVVVGFESFEAAATAVIEGGADRLLVPGAYPDVRSFIFEPRLAVVDQFIEEIPSIVLVEAMAVPRQRTPVLFFHPALRDVVTELEGQSATVFQRVEVASNPIACQRVQAEPAAYALTNEVAALAHGVRVLGCLRDKWKMPTVVFSRGEDLDLKPLVFALPPQRARAEAAPGDSTAAE